LPVWHFYNDSVISSDIGLFLNDFPTSFYCVLEKSVGLAFKRVFEFLFANVGYGAFGTTRQFHNNSFVLGYEIMNEPWPGDIYRNPQVLGGTTADQQNLFPLYVDVSAEIRKNDPNRIIFFEKALTDIITGAGFTSSPNNGSNDSLSYHAECTAGSIIPESASDILQRARFRDAQGNIVHFSVCDLFAAFSVQSAIQDGKKLRTATFLSEFGASENVSTVGLILQLADAELQSWTYYQYKFYNDITTTAGESEGFYNASGILDVEKVALLSRTYAQAIAGTPLFTSFNETTGVFILTLTINRDITSPTIIYLNEAIYYPRGFKVLFSPSSAANFTSPSTNLVHINYNDAAAVTGNPLSITIMPTA